MRSKPLIDWEDQTPPVKIIINEKRMRANMITKWHKDVLFNFVSAKNTLQYIEAQLWLFLVKNRTTDKKVLRENLKNILDRINITLKEMK